MAATSNTSATITQAVSFKIAYGTDKRRFNAPSAQLSKPGSYAVLRQQLLELFSLSKNPAASPYVFSFVGFIFDASFGSTLPFHCIRVCLY